MVAAVWVFGLTSHRGVKCERKSIFLDMQPNTEAEHQYVLWKSNLVIWKILIYFLDKTIPPLLPSTVSMHRRQYLAHTNIDWMRRWMLMQNQKLSRFIMCFFCLSFHPVFLQPQMPPPPPPLCPVSEVSWTSLSPRSLRTLWRCEVARCSSTARSTLDWLSDPPPSRGVRTGCCSAQWWMRGDSSWLMAHCWCRMWCTHDTTGQMRVNTSASPQWTDWEVLWVGLPRSSWLVSGYSILPHVWQHTDSLFISYMRTGQPFSLSSQAYADIICGVPQGSDLGPVLF